jgi:hypothetical protein
MRIPENIKSAISEKVKEYNSANRHRRITFQTASEVYLRGVNALEKLLLPHTKITEAMREKSGISRLKAFLHKAAKGTSETGTYPHDNDLLDAMGIEHEMYKKGGEVELLAPNGKPSNLTPEQWHLVRTPEFKAWFGDWENDPENASKVVDKNGEPLVCYHGTNREFNVFRDDVGRANDAGFYGKGFYFTFNTEKRWMPLARGEAGYYGSIIKDFFIKTLTPFDLSQLSKYKGVSINYMGVESFVFLANIAKTFPEIADTIKLSKSKYNKETDVNEIEHVPISVLPELIEKYQKLLKTYKTTDNHGEPVIRGYVKSEIVEYDYTSNGGKKGSYESTDDLPGRWSIKTQEDGRQTPSDEEIEIGLIVDAIEKYDRITFDYLPEGYMTRNPQITDAIKNNHDSILQSKSGDELVVFSPNQIKLADGSNTTFDSSNPDILFAEGGLIEVVLNEGSGNLINRLYTEWNNIKTEKQWNAWAEKVRNAKSGTYGTISLPEMLERFDFKNSTKANEIQKKGFISEVNTALSRYELGGILDGLSEEEVMYIDIISNYDGKGEIAEKYKKILKEKTGINYDEHYGKNDELLIENADLKNIKNKNDFLNYDNWIKYCYEIFRKRGFAKNQPKHIEGIVSLEKSKEFFESLDIPFSVMPQYEGRGNYAEHSAGTIRIPENVDINTFIHELGHYYDWITQYEGIAKNPAYATSPYGLKKSNEVYAENFMHYFIAKDWIKDNLPLVFNELDKTILNQYKVKVIDLIESVNPVFAEINNPDIRFAKGGEIQKYEPGFKPGDNVSFLIAGGKYATAKVQFYLPPDHYAYPNMYSTTKGYVKEGYAVPAVSSANKEGAGQGYKAFKGIGGGKSYVIYFEDGSKHTAPSYIDDRNEAVAWAINHRISTGSYPKTKAVENTQNIPPVVEQTTADTGGEKNSGVSPYLKQEEMNRIERIFTEINAMLSEYGVYSSIRQTIDSGTVLGADVKAKTYVELIKEAIENNAKKVEVIFNEPYNEAEHGRLPERLKVLLRGNKKEIFDIVEESSDILFLVNNKDVKSIKYISNPTEQTLIEEEPLPHIPAGEVKNDESLIPEKERELLKYVSEILQSGSQTDIRNITSKAKQLSILNANGDPDRTKIKEITELAVCIVGREMAHEPGDVQERYRNIVKLYYNQANLSSRTSESKILQQYSTPVPLAYLAGVFCGFDKKGKYFEPSAGNGLLTVAGRAEDFTVNEIDPLRRRNLEYQGFGLVTGVNAENAFTQYAGYFDAAITNPPFGSIRHDKYVAKGLEISKLEHMMAIHALDTVKNDGRCAIIIGGHTEFDSVGRIRAGADRNFYVYLARYYNVVDSINISGKMYSRQGTSFNVRLILIDGKKQVPEGFPPIAVMGSPSSEAWSGKPVNNYDEFLERMLNHV